MAEEDYCDCDTYGDVEPISPCTVTHPKARKRHRCDECRGPIFPGEKYKLIRGKCDGDFVEFRECAPCSELREWATISKPCFCAWEIGSLHERVKLMVADVATVVEGFQSEYDQRAAKFAERKAAS